MYVKWRCTQSEPSVFCTHWMSFSKHAIHVQCFTALRTRRYTCNIGSDTNLSLNAAVRACINRYYMPRDRIHATDQFPLAWSGP